MSTLILESVTFMGCFFIMAGYFLCAVLRGTSNKMLIRLLMHEHPSKMVKVQLL